MPFFTQALVGIIGLAGSVLLVLGPTNDRAADGAPFPRNLRPLPTELRAPPMPQVEVLYRSEMLPRPPEQSPAPARAAAAPRLSVCRRVYRVTAYCDRGTTASGTRAGVGQCAAPADIPFGAEIYIPALGRRFVVTDRTHRRFRHGTVDIFIPSEDRCRRFGCRCLDCEVRLPHELRG